MGESKSIILEAEVHSFPADPVDEPMWGYPDDEQREPAPCCVECDYSDLQEWEWEMKQRTLVADQLELSEPPLRGRSNLSAPAPWERS